MLAMTCVASAATLLMAAHQKASSQATTAQWFGERVDTHSTCR